MEKKTWDALLPATGISSSRYGNEPKPAALVGLLLFFCPPKEEDTSCPAGTLRWSTAIVSPAGAATACLVTMLLNFVQAFVTMAVKRRRPPLQPESCQDESLHAHPATSGPASSFTANTATVSWFLFLILLFLLAFPL